MDADVTPLGDAALLVAFRDGIDPAVNDRVLTFANGVRHQHVRGVRDIVPAYASCAVHFDPLGTDRNELEQAVHEAIVGCVPITAGGGSAAVDIPVCYGGPFGPDLAAVARFGACTEREVIELHAGCSYRVFMIGFLPGFAYLGPVDTRIAVPRHDSVRALVPAGSVGIAGRQTGIYPINAPGGWQIIGRTPTPLFDAAADPPARLSPGDTVRFVPIDPAEYATHSRSAIG
jgi:inhibitor of KinA